MRSPRASERGSAPRSAIAGFDRDKLPAPLAYLERRGLITAKPRGQWISVRCPSHKGGNENHPSLRVNLERGSFRCMTCGAHGGDVLDLHRLFTGAGFKQAARELGAMR